MTRFSYADGIRQAISEEMDRDPDVFVIGEDVGAPGGVFGVTKGLFDKFGPDRLCWALDRSPRSCSGTS